MIIGSNIRYLKETTSTMDDCKNMAHSGYEEGSVVLANSQKMGRGRFQRIWVSPPSENLHVSILLKPTFNQVKYLNMAASLAVVDTIKKTADLDSTIKWPNDVQIDGKKISGILIESEISQSTVAFAVVGIGLNINLSPENHPEIQKIATSLKDQTNYKFNRSTVFLNLLKSLDYYYSEIKTGSSLTSLWAKKLNTLGNKIEVSFKDNPKEEYISGTAISVNENGSLNIQMDDNTIFVANSGEVTVQKLN